jgi:hypothetical protein
LNPSLPYLSPKTQKGDTFFRKKFKKVFKGFVGKGFRRRFFFGWGKFFPGFLKIIVFDNDAVRIFDE